MASRNTNRHDNRSGASGNRSTGTTSSIPGAAARSSRSATSTGTSSAQGSRSATSTGTSSAHGSRSATPTGSRSATPTGSRSATTAGNAGTTSGRSTPSNHQLTWNLSILAALTYPLPEMRMGPGSNQSKRTHKSSQLNDIIHPPTVWEKVPLDKWVKTANRYIEAGKPATKHLEGLFHPVRDPLAHIQSESDVVCYGEEQLIFDVNHALHAYCGASIESYSEWTFGTHCRPDKAWSRVSLDNTQNPPVRTSKAFALMEFKVKGTISCVGLDRARLRSEEKIDNLGPSDDCRFSGDSLKIMKQVTKYARDGACNTNYVALFDGDYLFLCVFDRHNPYIVKATLVPCTTSARKALPAAGLVEAHVDGSQPETKVRKALLGWMLAAYEDNERGINTRAAAHPGDSGGDRQTRSMAAASSGRQPSAAPGGSSSSATMPTAPRATNMPIRGNPTQTRSGDSSRSVTPQPTS